MTEAEKMFNMAFKKEEKIYKKMIKEAVHKIKIAAKNGDYETYLYFYEKIYKYIPRMIERLENKGYIVSGTTSSGCIKISWDMEATKT